MDDVLQCLWDACGALRIAPDRPFESVFDFQGYVLQTLPPVEEAAKEQALEWLKKAVNEAEEHRKAGVVECLKRIGELSRRPPA